LDDFFCLIKY